MKIRVRILKRTVAVLLVGVMLLSLLSACSNQASEQSDGAVLLTRLATQYASLHTTTLEASASSDVELLDSEDVEEDCGTTYHEAQIVQILKGATLLAAGGGGSYSLGMSILNAFKEQNPNIPVEVTVYDVENMDETESTFGVGIMGSPSAHAAVSDLAKVALLSYSETLELAKRYGKDPEYALALEMGGANTLIPLLCAMKYNLKVVNADMCGRAVPGLETSLSAINGLPTAPFALTDTNGNNYDINMADPYDAAGVENVAIAILDKLESNGGFTGFYYSAEDISDSIPTDSLTRCLQIGQCIEVFEAMSIEERKNTNLFELLNEMDYEIQCFALTKEASKVQDFHQKSAAGGARDVGYYYLGVEGEVGNYFYIQFDNETMAISVLNETGTFDCIATAPCIITMYDENTGLPLTNADLKEHFIDGVGDELNVMIGIIKLDEKWWYDINAVTKAWKPYLEEAGYTGDIVRYQFD